MKKFRKSRIFKPEDCDWYKNALVGSWFSLDLGFYAEGYYLGANILVDETKRNPSNILVYPICFLYRHFIEIALKGIIDQYKRLEYSVKNIPTTHNLEDLLNIIVKLTKDHFNSPFPEDVEQIIREFNKLDPESQSFRYPSNKKGKHFVPGHNVIGLGTLKDNMSKVADELLGMGIGLSEDLKIQSEIN